MGGDLIGTRSAVRESSPARDEVGGFGCPGEPDRSSPTCAPTVRSLPALAGGSRTASRRWTPCLAVRPGDADHVRIGRLIDTALDIGPSRRHRPTAPAARRVEPRSTTSRRLPRDRAGRDRSVDVRAREQKKSAPVGTSRESKATLRMDNPLRHRGFGRRTASATTDSGTWEEVHHRPAYRRHSPNPPSGRRTADRSGSDANGGGTGGRPGARGDDHVASDSEKTGAAARPVDRRALDRHRDHNGDPTRGRPNEDAVPQDVLRRPTSTPCRLAGD